MQCFTELTPPTAVTHSLNLSFISPDSSNLIVAKTSLLQIFAIKSITTDLEIPPVNGDDSNRDVDVVDRRVKDEEDFETSFFATEPIPRAEHATKTKLVLVAEYTLSGTITSMVSVKTLDSKSGADSVLIAFRDAKLSLVEWDPELHGISTVSIHYYEQEEFDGSPWAPKLSDCVNYLSADPSSRCAALKFGVRNLAILPFCQGDEDTAMDDWDEELDGPRPADKTSSKLTNGDSAHEGKPYISSFVLRLSSLDPTLIHPVHLAFLYEYREPTFGILSSTKAPSHSLLQERKDHLSYMVFTLDLQQKASTTILAVTGLPFDLNRVIALPPPIGGALLVGENELIHVDQSGKTNGVGVNPFAKKSTSFGLADQSQLGMRLEGCTIQQLSIEDGNMLIILNTGELAILTFRRDGRTVSGLNVQRVGEESGGLLIPSKASCLSPLPSDSIFVGSEDADSVILGWTHKGKQTARRRSQAQADAVDDENVDEFDEDGDDDLYGDSPTISQQKALSGRDAAEDKSGEYKFRIHDSLVNIAPLKDITLSKPHSQTSEEQSEEESITSDLVLVGTSGRNKSGALSILRREIEPKVIGRFEFPEARGLWTMSAKRPLTKALQPEKTKSAENGVLGLDEQFDRLMIVSKVDENSAEESAVYALTSVGFEALLGTEFDPAAGGTIEAGTLGGGMRVIQVLRSEVRSYDGDLGLAQILPMFDDETGAEPKVVSASIADPFLLLIRDDASIFLASIDENNELEEVERTDDALLTNKWLSGCLYTDATGIFAPVQTDKGIKEGENIVLTLLNAEGALFIYALPDLTKPVYVAEGISFIPPTLSPDYAVRRTSARETITEILLADLGDEVTKSPYLFLRHANDDLTIYEPYRLGSGDKASLAKSLYFSKVQNPYLAKDPIVAAEEMASSERRDIPMRALSNVGGYTSVFLPGDSPSFVLKSSKSVPKVICLRGQGVRSMSGFNTAGCESGFIYVDNAGVARVSQLPPNTNFTEIGIPLRKFELHEDVHSVTYHPAMDVYVIGTSKLEPFELPTDDDYHRDWQQEDIEFKPLTERGYLKVISPTNWTIIDEVELEPYEVVMSLKSLNLETSEETHERRQLITVGTAISRGEDLAVRGRISVYDIVTVVPEIDRPETDKKLKLVAREEIPRGAITAVSEIGTQGFMIVAQGQKCMVRGLKEDGTLLPVAFMDMSTYVTCLKELPGTGLCVFGDALKGIWLAGYTEEPYKMTLFGKQPTEMEVISAEVFPIGRELFIVAADSDCNLHILQFDPEHPKSIQGQILLQRTTFSLGGHLPSTMTLLPRTKPAVTLPATADAMDTAADDTIPDHEILITDITGSISLLTPMSESQYRRLSTLTNHLSNTLFHPAGLNPKAYRVSSHAPEPVIGGRPIVDGTILMRWMELGSQRRAEVSARVGVDVEQVRDDLEELRSGVLYL